DNFINDEGMPQINPYLSSNLKVTATFEADLFGQTFTQTFKRDGFYTKNVERDISGFDDLYNHPLANNNEIVSGEEYSALGGGWTVSNSEYPFRIRFAPPLSGEWRCSVKIERMD